MALLSPMVGGAPGQGPYAGYGGPRPLGGLSGYGTSSMGNLTARSATGRSNYHSATTLPQVHAPQAAYVPQAASQYATMSAGGAAAAPQYAPMSASGAASVDVRRGSSPMMQQYSSTPPVMPVRNGSYVSSPPVRPPTLTPPHPGQYPTMNHSYSQPSTQVPYSDPHRASAASLNSHRDSSATQQSVNRPGSAVQASAVELKAEIARRQAAEARVQELEGIVSSLRQQIASHQVGSAAAIRQVASPGRNGREPVEVEEAPEVDDPIDRSICDYLERNPDFPVSIQKVSQNHYVFGDRGTVYVTRRGEHIVVRVGGGFKSLQVFMDERALMVTRDAAGDLADRTRMGKNR